MERHQHHKPSEKNDRLYRSQQKKTLLYVNIPFCPSKCHFCFKTDEIAKKNLLNTEIHDTYIKALIDSIKEVSPNYKNYTSVAINWGGGTPSILSVSQIKNLGEALKSQWNLEDIPFSVEATPETLSEEKLDAFLEIGVNRLSIGVQTFNEKTLVYLGRPHNNEDVHLAVKLARSAGLENINLDLIAMLPSETTSHSLQSVEAAINLNVPHITTHLYHPVPGTVLFSKLLKGNFNQHSTKEHIEFIGSMREKLEENGYLNYEFFHWSNDPEKYNYASLDYYFGHRGDTLGFGAGAISFIRGMGCLSHLNMPEYLENPTALVPGPYDLKYVLERALACNFGLHFQSIADTFGLDRVEVLEHPLVKSLSTVPGVSISPDRITLPPVNYFHEHTVGVSRRMANNSDAGIFS
ncbi:MAG: radical SAM protein [Gammaproteobacteria bacterium]|nr:radical SAM protein [Gammaproteobacteria bacterium]